MGSVADKLERNRVREVSRYYCATKFPVDNTFDGDITAGTSCDGGPELIPANDGPLGPVRHSPDLTLTAFAQLATHRLHCKRAFINIIDHTTQHIIAEATKTVSLRSHEQHAEDDQLYCGLQALPVAWGICPSTIHVFSHPDSEYAISTSNITSNMCYYIIRDLSQEEAYRERPYVAQWPFMRFYAEVPVKSPAGFVIGSLVIVDDKPRASLEADELSTLQEISTIITQHLESVRLQHDSKHAGRLMQGLSSFVKTTPDANGVEPASQVLPRSEERTALSPESSKGLEAPKEGRKEAATNTVFSRASGLIRQSMDLEGVVFFDARRSPASSSSKQPLCETLGFSTKPGVVLAEEALVLPQGLLQQISTKFSTGKIFNFDELGLVSADQDEHSSDAITARTDHGTDAALLCATFPGAHSIIFFPLQGAQESCYAGCFGWTFDAKRALQPEEITYFSAFSNSVMSEIFRLEAVAMDRAKLNFISSISHELRSPLHGILASAELLQACSSGPDQDSLVRMVDTCGRTLLDTMNHLFDYAKITNSSGSGSPSSNSDLSLSMSARSTLDLGTLVEEVVETVYAGHHFARASSAISPHTNGTSSEQPPVSVILDIDGPSDWVFKTEAGAWRRLVMNLFGNALKYTRTGSIRISLRRASAQHEAKEPQSTLVEFSVSDTGRGISQDYLRNRLYTPFAQEDSLSAGTGLGLSIVRGVVTALGGSISIQSEIGDGTTVVLSIPVETPLPNEDTHSLRTQKVVENIKDRRLTYTLLEAGESSRPSDQGLTKHALQTLSRWFGFERQPAKSEITPDLVVGEEGALLSDFVEPLPLTHHVISSRELPFESAVPHLILGSRFPAQLLRSRQVQKRIGQPFGPHKLASAIADLLSFHILPEALTDEHLGSGQIRSLKRSYEDMEKSGVIQQARGKVLDSPIPADGGSIPRNRADPIAKGRSTTLLLVDDNDINLKIISTYLQKLDCQFRTASNGLEAVECYQKAYREGTLIDVVLMDISMPVMDGFEATRRIRDIERRQTISPPSRIIALSGLTSSTSRQEAAASGVNMFLTKPVELKKLKGVLGLV